MGSKIQDLERLVAESSMDEIKIYEAKKQLKVAFYSVLEKTSTFVASASFEKILLKFEKDGYQLTSPCA